MKTDVGIFLRGMLMGAADVVPGVSGGTVALITGIYQTLLSSISRIDLEALRLLMAAIGAPPGRGSMAVFWWF